MIFLNAEVLFDDIPMMYLPSKDSDIITTLHEGDMVAVVEKDSCLWWKVAHNEYTGYVYSKHLLSDNVNEIGDVVVSLPRDCALALYKALEFVLK